MPARLEKAALVAHVTASVGWLGAVAAFLALALVGLRSGDAQEAVAAYLAMDVATRYVIVPLAFASLATGLLQSLGTRWGLFRHYWVLAKLLVTVGSTLLLLVHMQPIAALAEVAAEAGAFGPEHHGMRVQLVVDSAAAIGALLAAVVLSIFKPRGLTPHGRRMRRAEAATRTGAGEGKGRP